MTATSGARISIESETYPGIQPQLLLSAVRNTAEFAFADTNELPPHIQIILKHCASSRLSLPEYFELCIAAHFTTVATFVPTDLDQTIRLKLWRLSSPEETDEMCRIVQRSLSWDDRNVSVRQVASASGHYISGHYGEWFTLAVPAYWAAKRCNLAIANELHDQIVALVKQHEASVADLIKRQEWKKTFVASALIAHNLGDLDRVFEMWEIPESDLLRIEVFKLGHRPRRGYETLFKAGEMNKKFTAAESHRHFALRKPRSLRRSKDFLIGMGPFYDDWGNLISKHPELSFDELVEISEALIDGWERVNREQPVYGYARALLGIISNSPGRRAIEALPKARQKLLRAGPLAQMMSMPRETFEASWCARLKKYNSTC